MREHVSVPLALSHVCRRRRRRLLLDDDDSSPRGYFMPVWRGMEEAMLFKTRLARKCSPQCKFQDSLGLLLSFLRGNVSECVPNGYLSDFTSFPFLFLCQLDIF